MSPPRTIGYHIVISGYGLWLPGEERGSWSEAWDAQIGYLEPHQLHQSDPTRLRMSQERMKYDPVRLTREMMFAAELQLVQCVAKSDWDIVAASIEPTHVHLQLTYTPRDIDNTVKWIKDQATKAIHRTTPHKEPVWCKGHWRGFIYDDATWLAVTRYIESHNERRVGNPRPYAFLP